jgi:hypothetical protein
MTLPTEQCFFGLDNLATINRLHAVRKLRLDNLATRDSSVNPDKIS